MTPPGGRQLAMLLRDGGDDASAYLTDFNQSSMERVVELHRRLRDRLINNSTNNREWL